MNIHGATQFIGVLLELLRCKFSQMKVWIVLCPSCNLDGAVGENLGKC